jgi:hypothetical protein
LGSAVFPQFTQDYGKVVARSESVGVVVSEDPTATRESVLRQRPRY